VLVLDECGAVDAGGVGPGVGGVVGSVGAAGATNVVRAWTNRVQLMAQGSVAVDAPVRLVAAGRAGWTWSVRWADGGGAGGGDGRDAVQSVVAVGYPAPLLREVRVFRVGKMETNLLAGVDPQVLEGTGEVVVRVAWTRLAQLGEAAAHLLHYPYGCVEQTSSSLMPWLLARDTNAVWLRGGTTAGDIERAIRAGVYRLGSMQTHGGGLSYWPGESEAMYWGSAYAGVVLGVAKRRGVVLAGVDEGALGQYLEAGLRDGGGVTPPAPGGWRGVGSGAPVVADVNDRCLAALALALLGKEQPAYLEKLFDRRASMTPTARAWLALATLESGGSTNRAEELLRTTTPGGNVRADAFGCAGSETGAQLLAWTRLRPEAVEVDRLVAALAGGMKGGHWETTQGNAWVLFALTEYARRVESGLGMGVAGGRLKAGSEERSFEVGTGAAPFEWRRRWGPGGPGVAPMLAATGERPLYVEVTIEAQPRVWSQPAQDRGYALVRRYAVLDEDGKAREAAAYRVGDRVLVSLDFEARQAARYVVVDDPLPSVFEAIKPEFRSQAGAGLGGAESDWVSSHRELRADRAVFFCDDLRPGRYRIQYLARVRSVGVVSAPAAKIEEMYQPARMGLTGSGECRVQSAEYKVQSGE
jgi:uncharacterized protein YfaS (alpha-2-macroglobulin family)